MKRFQNYVWMAAGFAVLAVAISAVTQGSALAQIVKAAWIKNVDEPGRTPFSQDVVSSCNNFNCISNFAIVPADKRLVIEHISGIARPTSTATVVSLAEMATSSTVSTQTLVRHFFPMTLVAKAGDSIAANSWGFNQPVKAYVEAGGRARVTMIVENEGVVLFAQATISGYLVDITQ